MGMIRRVSSFVLREIASALSRLRRTRRSVALLSAPPEEVLPPVLRGFLPQNDLYLAPDIPPAKRANACRVCQVPAGEGILALIDATVTGTAKSALLLGDSGVWYHNEPGAKVVGAGMIPYAALAGRRVFRTSWSEVGLDRGEFFNRAGSQMTAEKIVELLRAVQRAVQFPPRE